MQIIFYFSTNKKKEKSRLCYYFQSLILFFSNSTLKSLKYIHPLELLWSFSQILPSEGPFKTPAAVRDLHLIPLSFGRQVS